MKLYMEIDKVKTKEDFISFMSLLINDHKQNPETWENGNLIDFLSAIQSWVYDCEGYYKNSKLQLPDNINWNFFANVFYAGKIYE